MGRLPAVGSLAQRGRNPHSISARRLGLWLTTTGMVMPGATLKLIGNWAMTPSSRKRVISSRWPDSNPYRPHIVLIYPLPSILPYAVTRQRPKRSGPLVAGVADGAVAPYHPDHGTGRDLGKAVHAVAATPHLVAMPCPGCSLRCGHRLRSPP